MEICTILVAYPVFLVVTLDYQKRRRCWWLMTSEWNTGREGSLFWIVGPCWVTTDVRQPWTNPQDSYFEYLIIRFDYLIIQCFDYLIIG